MITIQELFEHSDRKFPFFVRDVYGNKYMVQTTAVENGVRNWLVQMDGDDESEWIEDRTPIWRKGES